jgi:integrase
MAGSKRRPAKPCKRNGFWYLVRRVPEEFLAVDERGVVRLSTGIRIVEDPRAIVAAAVVAKLDANLEKLWRARRNGEPSCAWLDYQDGLQLARKFGFDYAQPPELMQRPARELLDRVNTLIATGLDDARLAKALLGGNKAPGLNVSALLEEFEKLSTAFLKDMSPKQQRKWRNPRRRALDVFIEAIGGDKPIGTLTRRDSQALRDYWKARAVKGEVEINTANKAIGRVAVMYGAINKDHQLNLDDIFRDLRIAGGGDDASRVPYPVEVVRDQFLAEGMFDDINAEARRIIYVIIETGMRPSELCNLRKDRIVLDAAIPHVRIAPTPGRKLKTKESERDIPLVGVALAAMRLQPDGFPRYRDNEDSLSSLVNKALEARRLKLPGVKQSLYSLRHTFDDRIRQAGAVDKVNAALMGHKWRERQKYGAVTLEEKHYWLSKIAFKAPSGV